MEDNNNTNGEEITDTTAPANLEINSESIFFLNITAKWAKGIALMGYIVLGMMMLLFLYTTLSELFKMPTPLSLGNKSGWAGIPSIFIPLFLSIPFFYLHHFANNLSKAISSRDSDLLAIAFRNIKRIFQFMGILVMLCFAMYIISMFFMFTTTLTTPQIINIEMPKQ